MCSSDLIGTSFMTSFRETVVWEKTVKRDKGAPVTKGEEGEEGEFAKIGEIRKDWQKSAFPPLLTDSPNVVRPN